MRQSPAGQGFAREQLEDRQPAALESVGRTCQINPPDAEFLLADLMAGSVGVRLKPVDPMPKGACVVLAQAFRVDDFQSFRGHSLDDPRNVHELTAGKDVFLHEIADAAAQAYRAEQILRDAVIENPSSRLEGAVYFPEVAREIMLADMLEHADAGDLVVRGVSRQIGVIEQLHPYAAAQAQLGDLRADVVVLILRERNAGRVDAVLLCGPEDQPAPTAPNIDEVVTWLQAELAADQ